MKLSNKWMFALVACLLLMPVTSWALSVIDEKTYDISISNIGLTGPFATVDASLNAYSGDPNSGGSQSATFTFTALSGYQISYVGLNITPDISPNWDLSSSPFNEVKSAQMDGFGVFNNVFKNSENSGASGAVDSATLTLSWIGLPQLTNLSELLLLNNKENSICAHLVSTTDGRTFFATTPIPAAAWLLASGLLGLLGVRRRMQG